MWVQYRDDQPSAHVLNWVLDSYLFTVGNFEPTTERVGTFETLNIQLPSYWSFNALYIYEDARWDTTLLRGGPALRMNAHESASITATTDTRESVWGSVYVAEGRDPTSDMFTDEVDLGVTAQVRPNLSLYVGPTWVQRTDPLQYVATAADGAGKPHYLLATIDQSVAMATVRVGWIYSPTLSLDIYAQPFIATGRYRQYKDVIAPHADDYAKRFHFIEGNEYRITDGTVDVTYGGSYSFARPDFDVRQLRSNVVLRWEYRPGSSLYAIWSHSGSSALADGRLSPARDAAGLFTATADDIVMVKLSYWLGL